MGIGWSFARPLTAAAAIEMFVVVMVVVLVVGCGWFGVWDRK